MKPEKKTTSTCSNIDKLLKYLEGEDYLLGTEMHGVMEDLGISPDDDKVIEILVDHGWMQFNGCEEWYLNNEESRRQETVSKKYEFIFS